MKSDKSSKDAEMSAEQQIPGLMFAAFPPLIHENRKAWLGRVARALNWKPRRARGLFYHEARIATADEWRTLNERLDAAKKRERERNELRTTHRSVGTPLSVDAREDLPAALPFEAGAAAPGAKRQAG